MRIELANSSVRYHDDTITVALSAGIAGFPAPGSTVETLIAHADEMLYQSKHQGRNRVTVYEGTEKD